MFGALLDLALVAQAQAGFGLRQGHARVLPDRVGAGARHGRGLGQPLQLAQARADFEAFGLQRRAVAHRFFEFGVARGQFFRRVDAGDARLERADFGGQLADRQRQRIFLRFERRQRALQRFEAPGAAGLAEAVARRFDEQRAAAAAFAVVGVRRDPFVRLASLKPASTESTRSMRASWSISHDGAGAEKRTTDSRLSSFDTGAVDAFRAR